MLVKVRDDVFKEWKELLADHRYDVITSSVQVLCECGHYALVDTKLLDDESFEMIECFMCYANRQKVIDAIYESWI